MPQFSGLDIHKTVVAVCVVDAHGTVCTRLRFPLTRSTLTAWARQLTAEDRVAVEATTNTWGGHRDSAPDPGAAGREQPAAHPGDCHGQDQEGSGRCRSPGPIAAL